MCGCVEDTVRTGIWPCSVVCARYMFLSCATYCYDDLTTPSTSNRTTFPRPSSKLRSTLFIGVVARGGNSFLPPKFWAVGKLLKNPFDRKFWFKNAKFWAENPHFWKLKAKLKFWAPTISFVGNLRCLSENCNLCLL